jgi:hypothetical protein
MALILFLGDDILGYISDVSGVFTIFIFKGSDYAVTPLGRQGRNAVFQTAEKELD